MRMRKRELGGILIVLGLSWGLPKRVGALWSGEENYVKPKVGRIEVVNEPEVKETQLSLKNLEADKLKAHLIQVIERMVNWLKGIEEWVEQEVKLKPNEQQELQRRIQTEIDWLNNEKEKISQADNKSNLRQLGRELNKHWQLTKIRVKGIALEVHLRRMEQVLTKLEGMDKKLQILIEAGRSSNKNILEIDRLEKDFRIKLGVAREKYEAAKISLEEVAAGGEKETTFKEGVNNFQESKQYAKYAIQVLRKIIIKLRAS